MSWPGPGTGFETAPSKEQELAVLTQQADSIENTLGELKSKIQELSKPEPDAGATADK
jgi:chaperonin cofactor prefoldin